MTRDEKIALFWLRVDRSAGPDACWPWTRSVFPATGYGQVTGLDDSRKPTTAHRLAWTLTHGDPGTYVGPSGVEVTRRVLHRCPGGSNRLCCNPAHLAVGSDQDNADDKVREGRQVRGEQARSAKLTEVDVLEIRRRYGAGTDNQYELAAAFGVSRTTIQPLVRGRTWKHLL